MNPKPTTSETNASPLDRAALDRQRRRHWARESAGAARFLAERTADELVERLSLVQREFEVAADLGGDGGALAERLSAALPRTRLLTMAADARWLPDPRGPLAVVGADEALPLREASFDLIVSNLGLHFTNDTPGTLVQIARALRADGLLLATLLGGETLTELRRSLLAAEAELTGGASPRVLPFPELRDVGALLQRAGLALPVIDQDRLTIRYDTLFDLMADLRAMGAANILTARSRRPAGRRLFLRAAEIYAERFADPDGRIRATFDVIHLSGWRPHQSQQKPLKPGSAKASLAEALKAR